MPQLAVRHPAAMLAWNESLTRDGVADGSYYLWQPQSEAIVLGLGQDAKRELVLSTLAEDGVAVLRRASGGGAVFLSPQVLCFGIIVPPALLGPTPDIRATFRQLTLPIIDACRAHEVEAVMAGISDLAAPDPTGEAGRLYKICGTAQLRKKRGVLVHGSLLINADTSRFERYLSFPSEVPDYRSARTHTDFCRTLSQLCAITIDDLATTLHTTLQQAGYSYIEPPARLSGLAHELYEGKYTTTDWSLHRKRPKGL